MQSGREGTLEERYAIKFSFKLEKNVTETYGMLQTAFGASCMNRASVFKLYKRFNAPVHNSILVTDHLTKMGIKTVPQPRYSPDLAPCDFWLFPKLRGCRYETIEEMKEAVTKVIDTLTQEDFHGAFQKLLQRYKCIAAGGDYLEGD